MNIEVFSKTIFKNMKESVIIQDLKKNILYINPAAEKLLGWSLKEVSGKKCYEIFGESNRLCKVVNSHIKDLLDGIPFIDYESSLKNRSGEVKTLNISILPFKEGDKVYSYILLLEDVTEVKRDKELLIEAKNKYQTLIEKMKEGIFLEDSKGNISFVNPRYLEMSGYTEEELYGKHWSFVVPPRFLDKLMKESAKRPEGISSTYESGVLRKDGKIVPIIVTASPLFSEKGEFEGVISVCTDITKQKQIEDDLTRAKEKYQMLIEKMKEGVVLEDTEGIIIFVNPKGAEMIGYTVEEVIGKHWTYFVPKNLLEDYVSEASKRPKGVTSAYEANILAKNGNLIQIHITANPLFSKDGQFEGTLSVITDITKLKQTEATLIETKEKYQMLIEKMKEVVILENTEGIITFVNERGAEMIGSSVEKIIGKHWSSFVPPDYIDIYVTEGSKRSKGISSTYEAQTLTKDGKIIPIIITASPLFSKDGQFEGVLSVITDITEIKQTEEALIETKEKYQMLIEKMEEGIFVEDAEGIITFVNPKYLEMSGYTEEELYGKHWSFVVPSDTKEMVDDETKKRPKGISSTYETRILRKDGQIIPIINTASPIFSKDSKFEGVISVITDITKQKQTEKMLRKSEREKSAILDSILDIVSFYDNPSLKIVWINKAAGIDTSQSIDQIVGNFCYKILFDRDKPCDLCPVLKSFDTGYPEEDEIISKDKVWLVKGYPVKDENNNTIGIVEILKDRTEQKKTEITKYNLERRRRKFIETTSHELRTPVTSIKGFIELLKNQEDILSSDRRQHCFDIIDRNLARLERLIHDVSQLSKIERGVLDIRKKVINFTNYINNEAKICTSLLGDQFDFNSNIVDSSIYLNIDTDRISQVLTNVITNAVNHTPPENRKIIMSVKSDVPGFVRIEISDNGAGIEPKNLEWIFESFVSIETKYQFSGTGIGLHISRIIVNAHDGVIKAFSEGLDKGSTFTIDLPIHSLE